MKTFQKYILLLTMVSGAVLADASNGKVPSAITLPDSLTSTVQFMAKNPDGSYFLEEQTNLVQTSAITNDYWRQWVETEGFDYSSIYSSIWVLPTFFPIEVINFASYYNGSYFYLFGNDTHTLQQHGQFVLTSTDTSYAGIDPDKMIISTQGLSEVINYSSIGAITTTVDDDYIVGFIPPQGGRSALASSSPAPIPTLSTVGLSLLFLSLIAVVNIHRRKFL